MKLIYHPGANEDTDAAAEYYLLQGDTVYARFTAEVERVLAVISEQPLLGSRVGKRVRRYLLKGFPYSVIYVVAEDHILVFAIAHFKRRPGYWRKRLRDGWSP